MLPTVSKATQVARALRELGFFDVALWRQRAKRAQIRSDRLLPPQTGGWFHLYRDPRPHGYRVKLEARVREDENKEVLLDVETTIREVVPEASTTMSPNERMLTAIWLELK